MQPSPTSSFDLLIIGAGLVGNSLALALAGHATVAIIEANQPNATPRSDERALALSFATQRILQALNVWQKIQPHSTPIQQVHVSQVGRFGSTRFSAEEYAVEALGHVVSAQTLTDILQHSVTEQPAIVSFYGSSVQKITPFPEGYYVQVQTADGLRTFTTRLLVGADGIHSTTRKLLGIQANYAELTQTALTARIQLNRSHQHVAYERFANQGVLAALPAMGNEAAMVWTVATASAEKLATLSNTDFCAQFQAAFGYRLGQFLSVGKRQSYPLRSMQALEQIRPHAVLLGNAAHTLHPVAAQGFNLSLRDVAALAEIVRQAMQEGSNPGQFATLQKYAACRKKHQLQTMGLTEGILRLFSHKTLPWPLLKEAGLISLELLPFAKRLLAQRAMGNSDNLPRWVLMAND